MKLLIFILATSHITVWAREKPTASPQEKGEVSYSPADKQVYASLPSILSTISPQLYKISPQAFGAQKSNALSAAQDFNQNINYSPQANYVPEALLKYYQTAPQGSQAVKIPPQLAYGFAPQQEQYQYVPQSVAYAQPGQKASAASAIGKIGPVPQSAALNFSPASEVSSFRFSSPLVTYSNLGVLNQVNGKLASSGVRQEAHAASVASQPTYSVNLQKAAPAVPENSQQFVYSAPQQLSQAAPVPQKVAYSGFPQAYNAYNAAQQQVAYAPQRILVAAQVPQAHRLLYASQGHSGSSSPKIVYASAPQQHSAGAPQIAYISAPQQVAYSPQQLAYSAPDLQQYAQAAQQPQQYTYSVQARQQQQQQQQQYSAAASRRSEEEQPQASYDQQSQLQYPSSSETYGQ